MDTPIWKLVTETGMGRRCRPAGPGWTVGQALGASQHVPFVTRGDDGRDRMGTVVPTSNY